MAGTNGFMDFLNSPGGSSLLSGAMGAIGGIGQGIQQRNQNAQNVNLGLGQLQLQQQPLGYQQNYMGSNMLRSAILQKMQSPGGGGLMPGNPALAGRIPQQQGFTPDASWQGAQNPYSYSNTQNALTAHQTALNQAINLTRNPKAKLNPDGTVAQNQGGGHGGLFGHIFGGIAKLGLGMIPGGSLVSSFI